MSGWVLLRAWLWHSLGLWRRNLAQVTGARGDYAAAVRALDRALALAPAWRDARLDRGVLLWRELDQPAEALADFDQVLAANPGDARALLNRAQAGQALGLFESALADLSAYLSTADRDGRYDDIAIRMSGSIRQLLREQEDKTG